MQHVGFIGCHPGLVGVDVPNVGLVVLKILLDRELFDKFKFVSRVSKCEGYVF